MNFFVRKKREKTNGDLVLEDCFEIVCKKEAVEEIKSFLQHYDSVNAFIKNVESEILRGPATIEATGESGKILWICKDGEILINLEEYPNFSMKRKGEVITYGALDFLERKRYRKDEMRELTTGINYNELSKNLTQGDKEFFIKISGAMGSEIETNRRNIDDYLMSLDLDELPKVQDVAEEVLGLLQLNDPEENKNFDIEYSMTFSGQTADTFIKKGIHKQIGIMDDKKQVYNLCHNGSWTFLKPGYEISFHASKNSSGKVKYVMEKENLDFLPAQEFEQVRKKVEELFAKLF